VLKKAEQVGCEHRWHMVVVWKNVGTACRKYVAAMHYHTTLSHDGW